MLLNNKGPIKTEKKSISPQLPRPGTHSSTYQSRIQECEKKKEKMYLVDIEFHHTVYYWCHDAAEPIMTLVMHTRYICYRIRK